MAAAVQSGLARQARGERENSPEQQVSLLVIPRKVNCPRRNRRVDLAQAGVMLCHLICSWVRCTENHDWDCTCWEQWTQEILLWIKTKKRKGKKKKKKPDSQ